MSYEILPLRKAFLWIFLITLCFSGGAAIGLSIYRWHQHTMAADDRYRITTILQQPAGQESLPSSYFAEILGLSIDRSSFLTTFQLKKELKKITAIPFVENASIKKVFPSTIYIEYSLRKPIAFIGDFANCCIDANRITMPFLPFFSNEQLPEIILGELEFTAWGQSIQNLQLESALEMLNIIDSQCRKENMRVKRIDFSKINAPSAGQREIVLILNDSTEQTSFFLRLCVNHYRQNIRNFWNLKKHLADNDKNIRFSQITVDLRVPHLAFLSPVL